MALFPFFSSASMCGFLIMVVADVSGSAIKPPAGGNQAGSMYARLYDYVMTSSDPLLIPTTHLPIAVTLQTGVLNIHGVDRERSVIDLTRWGRWTWQTDLIWNPEEFRGIESIAVPFRSLWIPDVHLYNQASEVSALQEVVAIVSHNGSHSLSVVARSEVYCGHLAVEDSCALKYASWGQNVRIMELEHSPPGVDNDFGKAFESYYYKASKFDIFAQSSEKTKFKVAKQIADLVDMITFHFSFKDKRPKKRSGRGPFTAIFQWQ